MAEWLPIFFQFLLVFIVFLTLLYFDSVNLATGIRRRPGFSQHFVTSGGWIGPPIRRYFLKIWVHFSGNALGLMDLIISPDLAVEEVQGC